MLRKLPRVHEPSGPLAPEPTTTSVAVSVPETEQAATH
jgi:hypothetical protein